MGLWWTRRRRDEAERAARQADATEAEAARQRVLDLARQQSEHEEHDQESGGR
jgi:hypothetical protein